MPACPVLTALDACTFKNAWAFNACVDWGDLHRNVRGSLFPWLAPTAAAALTSPRVACHLYTRSRTVQALCKDMRDFDQNVRVGAVGRYRMVEPIKQGVMPNGVRCKAMGGQTTTIARMSTNEALKLNVDKAAQVRCRVPWGERRCSARADFTPVCPTTPLRAAGGGCAAECGRGARTGPGSGAPPGRG